MKKLICVCLAAVALASCGSSPAADDPNNTVNTLLKGADTQNSMVGIYYFDGEKTEFFHISSEKDGDKLIDAITGIPCEQTEEYPSRAPAWGISVQGKDEKSIDALWAEGIWCTGDGKRYKIDLDFTALTKDLQKTETNPCPASSLPAVRYLAEQEGKWNKAFMSRAQLPESKGITAEITEQSGTELTVTYKNTSDEDSFLGYHYSLAVELEGEWYGVPTLPGRELYFIELALELPAGGEETIKHDIASFGTLPEGKYMLISNGCSAEFEK
ncbi:MAG: hypothetical protein IJ561_09095 [Ruminococcus sp.]|nr:hypothetical protein [Ruminococcus sp.]MBR1393975.1 hypothetical protein [Ruminococcus sp.]